MKFLSWNVNGLRAVMRKDAFLPFIKKERPDALCLQEVKIDADAKDLESNLDFPGYAEYWNHAEKKGYAGTMTLVKEGIKVLSYKTGIGVPEFDREGRVQTLEFDKFYLVNVYFPNTRDDLSRLDFKIDFNEKLHKFVKKLEKKKPVIITGDFNVAHEEIDIARPKANDGKAGFHPRERAWMTKFLASDFVDTYRELNPKKVQYSWWSYRGGARERNVGWRIDYWCVSESLGKRVEKAYIRDRVMGSDHCPVGVELGV